jgi:hypothetical protein
LQKLLLLQSNVYIGDKDDALLGKCDSTNAPNLSFIMQHDKIQLTASVLEMSTSDKQCTIQITFTFKSAGMLQQNHIHKARLLLQDRSGSMFQPMDLETTSPSSTGNTQASATATASPPAQQQQQASLSAMQGLAHDDPMDLSDSSSEKEDQNMVTTLLGSQHLVETPTHTMDNSFVINGRNKASSPSLSPPSTPQRPTPCVISLLSPDATTTKPSTASAIPIIANEQQSVILLGLSNFTVVGVKYSFKLSSVGDSIQLVRNLENVSSLECELDDRVHAIESYLFHSFYRLNLSFSYRNTTRVPSMFWTVQEQNLATFASMKPLCLPLFLTRIHTF